MRATGKIAIAAGFLCSMAFGASAPVMAQGYYYGGGPYGPYGYRYRHDPPGTNCTYLGCCPRGWSVQGGVCKPYQGWLGPGPGPGYYRRY